MRNLIYFLIIGSAFFSGIFGLLGVSTFPFNHKFAIHAWLGSGIWLVISLLLCLGLWIQKKIKKEEK